MLCSWCEFILPHSIPVRSMAIRSVFEYLLKSINIPLCSVFRLLSIPFFRFLFCWIVSSFFAIHFVPNIVSLGFHFVLFIDSLSFFSFCFCICVKFFLHFTHFDVAPKSIQNYLRLLCDTCQKCMPKAVQFLSFSFHNFFSSMITRIREMTI